MEYVLTTDRLQLTPMREGDVDIAIEMFTDPAVVEYVGGPMSVDDIRAEVPNWLRRGGDGCIGIWSVSDIESGEKYGSGALLPMPVEEDDTDWSLVVPGEMPACDVEFGFFLKRSAWGRGFGTEVCKRLLRFAFEDTELQEIVAVVDEANMASRRALEKAGFSHVGIIRAYGQDARGYRVTLDDWSRSVASRD